MKLYELGLIIILCLAFGAAIGGQVSPAISKHLYGYEKAIHVPNDLPDVQLYYSIAGVPDSIWWNLPTVIDRSMRLAEIYGYNGADIACSADGNWLYILGNT